MHAIKQTSQPLTYTQAKHIAQNLLEESRRLQMQQQQQEDLSKSATSIPGKPGLGRSDSMSSRRSGLGGGSYVSARFQREKIAEVMASVEREGAIIDAVMGRLEKMQV